MVNEGNQIHNFISCSGSDFLTSYGSGSGSTRQKVTVRFHNTGRLSVKGTPYRRSRLDRPESGIGGQTLIGIKTAEGKQNFKTCLHFFIIKFSQQYIANIIFAKVLKAISDPFANCRKEFDYHMKYSSIFMDFLDFACGS
jgi:hypothetical protein